MEMFNKNRSPDLKFFTWLVLLAQVFGLSAVVLVAVWMGHFQKGFAWQSNPKLQFNYHPLFMVIGMIFLYSDAILAYRVFRNDNKIYIKVLHAGMQILALIFAVVGLKAVFDSHNLPEKPIPNLYSLHSWLGLGAVILFSLQWVFGFVVYLLPVCGQGFKKFAMPHHQFLGMAILCLSVCAALTGITEKVGFSVKDYKDRTTEAYVINFLGLMILGLVTTVIYIVTRPEYKRPPSPDEDHVPLEEN